MTLRRAGNRIFAGLSSILDLPGVENLDKIDIAAAQPTYPLGDIVQRESVIFAFLAYNFDGLAAGSFLDVPFDPYSTDTGDADTREFLVSGAQGQSPVTVASAGSILAQDWDAYLVGFGITTEDVVITTPGGSLYMSFNRGSVSLGDVAELTTVIRRFDGDTDFSPVPPTAVESMRPNEDNSGYTRYPILLPNEVYTDGSVARVFCRINAPAAAADYRGVVHGRLALVRKGTLPPLF